MLDSMRTARKVVRYINETFKDARILTLDEVYKLCVASCIDENLQACGLASVVYNEVVQTLSCNSSEVAHA